MRDDLGSTWRSWGRSGAAAAIGRVQPVSRLARQTGKTYSAKPPEKMIRAYLRGFDLLFPHVSPAFNGRSYFVWSPGDPHIRGAYSFLAVGQFTAFNGIQGKQEGNLHFAGEQTSLNFQGYIAGALRSGYRCAKEVGGAK